jgi:hypothetical protein
MEGAIPFAASRARQVGWSNRLSNATPPKHVRSSVLGDNGAAAELVGQTE